MRITKVFVPLLLAALLPTAAALADDGAHHGSADHGPGRDAAAKGQAYEGDPYPLAVCPISGGELDESAVAHVHEGRQLRFCCSGCIGAFEADPQQYLAEIDALIASDQRDWYPLQTCLVAGAELGSMGDPVEHVWGNRLVRFCCAGCIGAFEADPASYIAELDAAVVAGQGPEYKLENCIVMSERALGAEPAVFVTAGRLFKLCCPGCADKIRAHPAAWIARHDELVGEER